MSATKVVYSNRKGVQRPAGANFGPGAVVCAQGIYEESITKEARLGTRLQVGDRVFRYAKSGAAIAAGYLAQGPAFNGASTELQTTMPITVAAAVNDTRLHVNAVTTVQTANLFADGWATIFETGVFLAQIKSNTSLAASGTSSYVELYDGLPVAITTSAQVELMTNPFSGVITLAAAGTVTGPILGVTPRAVTSGYYFWLQTYGPCGIMPQEALSLDDAVGVSNTTTAGAVEQLANCAMRIGFPMLIGTAGEGCLINLQLFA